MKNVLILGAGGQIARHVINQLADKQTIKQTLFARQPAKIHKPYPTNSKIIMGDVLNHAALKQAMQGQDVVCQPYGGRFRYSGKFSDRCDESL